MVEISAGIFATIIAGAFTILGGIIVFIVKANTSAVSKLLEATQANIDKRLEDALATMQTQMNSMREHMMESLSSTKEAREVCESRCSASILELKNKNDSMRDRWDSFLEKYTVIDATRGNKVDALFRTVDELREAMKSVKPSVHSKIDDSFKAVKSELQVYVRDIVLQEVKRV